jgi:hypothetical protein
MKADAALVRDYALTGSEAAFREIVERYLPLVHSAALRMVNGDTHRARLPNSFEEWLWRGLGVPRRIAADPNVAPGRSNLFCVLAPQAPFR